MQAAIVENFLTDFNFNNIEVKQVPKPAVKPGCALVKIHAAAINPADVFVRSKHYFSFIIGLLRIVCDRTCQ